MNMDEGDTRLLIETCRKHGLLRNQVAYVLATAYHETAHTLEPVRETLASTDAQAIARLDRAWERGQLSWVSRPYWRTGFFGRGYVQLTHEYNYRKAGGIIGVDLVSDPSKALEAEISAEITVRGMLEGWFTTKKLGDYITLQRSDYVGARRIVNGTDRARAIAEHAREYEAALISEGYGNEKRPPVINERRDGKPPRSSSTESTTVRAGFIGILGTLTALIEPISDTLNQYSEALGIPVEWLLGGLILGSLGYVIYDRVRKGPEGDEQ